MAFDLTVLMYHYVRDPGDAAEDGSGIPGLPLARFEAQLDWIAANYAMLGWPALRAHLMHGEPLPPKACLLTFDDGVRDHYVNVFPALRRRGLSGLFFSLARQPGQGLALGHKLHFLLARLGYAALRSELWQGLGPDEREAYRRAEAGYRASNRAGSAHDEVACFKTVLQRGLADKVDALLGSLFEKHLGPERQAADRYYLTPGQIAEMSTGGMHFGGHTRSHPWLDAVRADRQASEIAASAARLREIEPGPWAFAYPYGGFEAGLKNLLQARGFAAAFTTIEQTRQVEPFFIGRLDGESLNLPGERPPAATTGSRYG